LAPQATSRRAAGTVGYRCCLSIPERTDVISTRAEPTAYGWLPIWEVIPRAAACIDWHARWRPRRP
jgi:hypothetical protein